jgi:hypothetical protein
LEKYIKKELSVNVCNRQTSENNKVSSVADMSPLAAINWRTEKCWMMATSLSFTTCETTTKNESFFFSV